MRHLGVGGKNVNTCIIFNILRIYVSFSFMRMILSTVYNRWGNIWWVGFDFGMDSTKIEENDWHLIYYVWWPHNPSEWRELRYKVWGCQFLLFLSYLLPGGCTKKGLRHKARSRSIRRTSSTRLEVGWIMIHESWLTKATLNGKGFRHEIRSRSIRWASYARLELGWIMIHESWLTTAILT